MVAGGKDQSLLVWDVARGTVAHSIQATSLVVGVAFAPDRDTYASAGCDGLGLWKTETGENLRWFKKPPNAVMAVALFSDEESLVSNWREKTERVWGVGKGDESRGLKGPTAQGKGAGEPGEPQTRRASRAGQ